MHDLISCQWVLGHLTGGEMYAPSKHDKKCVFLLHCRPSCCLSLIVVSRVCPLEED